MIKLGVLLIFAISLTLGYTENSEYERHYLVPEDMDEAQEPKYTNINSEYERHYLMEPDQDVRESQESLNSGVGAVYRFQERRGEFMTGDKVIAQGTQFVRSRNGAPSLISTNFTYPGPKNAHYVDVRLVQTSNKQEVRVTGGGLWDKKIIVSIDSFATLYQNVTVIVYGK